MKAQGSFVGVSLLIALLSCSAPLAQSARPVPGGGGPSPLGALPLVFVENAGQWDDAARFVARKGPLTARFEAGAMVLALRGASESEVVRLAFEGSSSGVWIEGEDPIPGVHNFFVGERSRWRTDVPGFASVRYHDLYPGVNLRLRDRDGRLEYDLLLGRAVDLERVVVRCDGVQCLEIDAAGNLVLATALGELIQAPPVTWQVLPGGEKRPVECRYRRIDAQRYGFEALGPEPDLPLVVDPGLEWSTFLGGDGAEYIQDMVIASDGDVVACGNTTSSNFQTSPGAYDPSHNGERDAIVVRMDPEKTGAGQLVYATILGGAGTEYATSVSVNGEGVLTVVGNTDSADFPTTADAWSAKPIGLLEAFVARLDPSLDGSAQLVYSSFVGGTRGDNGKDHHVDGNGVVTMTGWTDSADFPTTPGAFDTSHNGGRDGFVCRLDPSEDPANQIVYSSFLGGSGDETMNGWDQLAVDDLGQITVASRTTSTDFPTTVGAYDTSHNGGIDGFVLRLDPDLSLSPTDQLLAATYLGGSDDDHLNALSVDATGVVTVAGATYSTDYPTTPAAYQPTHASAGLRDCFVTRLAPDLTTLVASTFLGGQGWEYFSGLDAGGAGLVTAVGLTVSDTFPTTPGAYETTKGGFGDGLVCRLDPSLGQLLYSSFLAGDTADYADVVVVDHELAAFVGGETLSSNFPTTSGAFDTTFGGPGEAYLAKLDLMPTGAQPYGVSTPGCAGPIAIGVNAMPRTGESNFEVLCANAPPSGAGLMAISLGKLDPPFHILGVDAFVDPLQLVLLWNVSADKAGYTAVSVPIGPATPPDLQVYAQFFWLPDGCAPEGIASSNALELTIQP